MSTSRPNHKTILVLLLGLGFCHGACGSSDSTQTENIGGSVGGTDAGSGGEDGEDPDGTGASPGSGGDSGGGDSSGGAGSGGAGPETGGSGSGGAVGSGGEGSGGIGGDIMGGAPGSGGATEETIPSCQDLPDTCGPAADEDCCTSLLVPGGDFLRINDEDLPATVSDFRLDKFEVTVGRFRKFVAILDEYEPAPGSGKHTHLNDGQGLLNSHEDSVYEGGWDSAWNESLTTWEDVDPVLCEAAYRTWTSTPGAHETRPINCVSWYVAYAFCIWDGGFLPSEAEWNYAAAGGGDEQGQRLYPWGNDAPLANTDRAIYGCRFGGDGAPPCTGVENIAPVGSAPAGNGRWGHADLAGNVWESLLDWYSVTESLPSGSCDDCAFLPEISNITRSMKGGGYANGSSSLLTTGRTQSSPGIEYDPVGFRCARAP